MRKLTSVALVLAAAAALAAGAAKRWLPVYGCRPEGTGSRCEVVGPARHHHVVPLAAGEVLAVAVQQQGADVALRLLGPAGEELATADSPTGAWGREELWWIAPVEGVYQVQVEVAKRSTWAYGLELRHGPATPGDRQRARAFAIYRQAERHRDAKEPEPAALLYREAAELFAEAGEPLAEGRAWQRLAGLAEQTHRWQEAAELWSWAAAAYGRAGAERDQAVALEQQGRVLVEELDRYGEAEPSLLAALEIWERLEAGAAVVAPIELSGHHASTLYQLGRVDQSLGRPLAAIERFRAAAEGWRRGGGPAQRALALADLAGLFSWLRHLEPAVAALEEALAAARTGRERKTLSRVLGRIGTLERRRGELAASERALAEALALERAGGEGGRIASALNDLAQTRADSGDLTGARLLLEEALGLAQREGDPRLEASSRMLLGWILERAGEPAAALLHLERAVVLQRGLADRRYLPSALWGLGRALAKLGRLPEAREAAAEAVDLTEEIRRGLAEEAARGSFLGDRQRYYELLVAIEMDLERSRPGRGWARRALGSAERGRARLLLDALAGTRPPQPTPAPPPATVLAAAEAGLPAGTELLYYALGEERSWLWRRGSAGLETFELGPRAEIEEAARTLHELLKDGLRTDPEAVDRAAAEVARQVLWPAGPLEAQHLVVVADGALHYVPFGLLPAAAGSAAPRLVERVQLTMAPSLAVWALTPSVPLSRPAALTPTPLPARPLQPPGRGAQEGIPSGLPLSREGVAGGSGEGDRGGEGPSVAVVANPVFRPDDPRLAVAGRRGLPDFLAGESGFTADWLASLPATGREAEAILSRVPAERRTELTGLDASVGNVVSGALASASIVHFATHGLLDTDHPELSGLVLSLYDAQGRPQDGILWVHRLDELSLSAELVVLSACSTALGKELRGEGLVGLVQGFLAAGARQVLVTLWDVEDEATFLLMDRFYEELLERGQPPAAALATAQRALAADPRTAHPYHWAGFVLVGGER
ncbi:MAG TPA: CHAT domain-containing protein [Thermoanaerobaculia bacterium]|nr:CHAT domain-containing protein [Thermoanaerobaculia bacterium]